MTPKNITVYDPAMCCSTGVCGPEVDPRLARFSSDLAWLAAQGVGVRRFNLAQEPGAFVDDPEAKGALEGDTAATLPLIKADDVVVSRGAYPSRAALAAWAGLAPAPTPGAVPEMNSRCCGPARDAAAPEKTSGCC